MSDYYEEDQRMIEDISPSELCGKAKVTFDVPMPTIEQVTAEVARQLIGSMQYQSKSSYQKMIEDGVNERISALIKLRAKPALEEALTKSLQPTDGFGNPLGPPVTLESRIAEHIAAWGSELVDANGKGGKVDNWTRDRYRTRIERCLEEIIWSDLKQAVAEETKKITAQLKADATASIAKQIAERISGMVLK